MSSSAQDPRPPTKQRLGRHEGFYPTNTKKTIINMSDFYCLLSRLNIRCMQSPFLGLILPQTAKPSHHLVHFIQQDDWVLDANCFQCIQNSSWHGSYVSAPITRYQQESPQFKEIRNQKKEGDHAKKVTTMSRYPCTHIQIVSLTAVF